MKNPAARFARHLGLAKGDDIVSPERLPPRAQNLACGQCHSIWSPKGNEEAKRHNRGDAYIEPGQPMDQRRHLMTPEHERATNAKRRENSGGNPPLLEARFWADGVPRITGREFNSLLVSPCSADGNGERAASCLSCHSMHPKDSRPEALAAWRDDQLKPGMRGDRACTRCHAATRYAADTHTHHAPKSEGGRCMNCHMPRTTYGLLSAIRSHTVTSPRVPRDWRNDRPDACGLCHIDRPQRWVADQLKRFWGVETPGRDALDARVPGAVARAIAGDASIRALTAWHLGWSAAHEASRQAWIAPVLMQLLVDPYPAVRQIAARSLRRLPGFKTLDYDATSLPATRNKQAAAAYRAWLSNHRRGREGAAGAGWRFPLPSGPLSHDDINRLIPQRDESLIQLFE